MPGLSPRKRFASAFRHDYGRALLKYEERWRAICRFLCRAHHARGICDVGFAVEKPDAEGERVSFVDFKSPRNPGRIRASGRLTMTTAITTPSYNTPVWYILDRSAPRTRLDPYK
jgi:hypothetical protein